MALSASIESAEVAVMQLHSPGLLIAPDGCVTREAVWNIHVTFADMRSCWDWRYLGNQARRERLYGEGMVRLIRHIAGTEPDAFFSTLAQNRRQRRQSKENKEEARKQKAEGRLQLKGFRIEGGVKE